MKLSWLLIVTILFCIACKTKPKETTEKFDTTRWSLQEDNEYPHRKKMLNDLITNHLPHGMQKEEILHLLGQPGYSINGHLYYPVSAIHIPGIPIPFGVKTLVIKLNKDSTLEWRKTHN